MTSRLGNGPPQPRPFLPRVQPLFFALDDMLPLLDVLLAFGQDNFNVARIRHVWINLFESQIISTVNRTTNLQTPQPNALCSLSFLSL